ncbi:Hermansky-Pudlak syndrome 5 protein homolog [Haliotis rubra]|uniref:Hermansky-Pudlak syndrome 5 protein homolog n=1 Tax=Haliotis rubra TaxID=36100 RepID=UPI001EE58AE2|nr:Hermansky-Pudlak syndrome 5 protein homolog [Haliotis rubra]
MASGGWSHVLTELCPLDALEAPLQRSARLRYTCVSVSKKYIALGSNTGGVYIFTRDTLKHLQVVYGDVESSPLSCTALSPNDNFVAYSTGSGHVVVMEMNIEKRQKPERIRLTSDHVGCTVTCLQWGGHNFKLFVGDNVGKITVCYIPSSKAKTLFLQPSEIILRLDTTVVQLDWWGEKLLVSTLTRSYLLNTNKQQYTQIGKKLRDGEYGSCFFLEPSSQYPVIYCSRPGSRVWEVDFDANVLNTHQFKQLLAIPPLPVIKFHDPVVKFADPSQVYTTQSVGFNKLCRLGPYLITWSNRRVYVFDPVRVRIILWNEQPANVLDMVTSGTEIYIFLADQSLCRLHLLPVERCLQLLLAKQVWSIAGELLCYLDNFVAVPFIQRHIKLGSLSELVSKLLNDGHADTANRVQAIIDEMSNLSDSTESDSMNGDVADGQSAFLDSAVKLPSGIFLVNNASKTSLEEELYNPADSVQARFTVRGGENKMASLQDQTLLRYMSMDNLDSRSKYGSHHQDAEGESGMRKSFSTTDLDTIKDERQSVVGVETEEAISSSTSLHSDKPESQNGESQPDNFVDVDLDTEEVREQSTGKVSMGNNSSDRIKSIYPSKEEATDDDNINQVPSKPHQDISPALEDAAPVIAESVSRRSGKTGRKKRVMQVDIPSPGISTSDIKKGKSQLHRSASTGSMKKTAKKKELKSVPSVTIPIIEEDSDRSLYMKVDQDFDTISIDTVSSIDEDSQSRAGDMTPDTLSIGEGDNVSLYSTHSRSRTPIFHIEEDPIPSLLQRLSASGVSAEDSATNSKDGSPVSQSSLGQSVDSNGSGSPSSQSPKMALLAVKESLSLKFSSKTKSFMQTIRKKSLLSMPNSLPDQPGPEQEETTGLVGEKPDTDDTNRTESECSSSMNPLSRFSASVDLTELESSTAFTKRKLQDITLLMNPESARSILRDWMTGLHIVLQKLHQEVEQQRKVRLMARKSRRRQLSSEKKAILIKDRSKDDPEYTEDEVFSQEQHGSSVTPEETQSSYEGSVGRRGSSSGLDVMGDGHNSFDHDDMDGCPSSPVDKSRHRNSSVEEHQCVPLENGNHLGGSDMSDTEDEDPDQFKPINWADINHINDPFKMSRKLHTDVAELCSLCLQSGCHGNISEYILPNFASRHPSTNSSSGVTPTDGSESGNQSTSQPISPSISPPMPTQSAAETQGHPGSHGHSDGFMCEAYCDACDSEVATVVRCYYHFLSMDQLRKTVSSWRNNWLQTWTSMVKASQELGEGDPVCDKILAKDYNGATDLLRSLILPNKQAFLGHVARLFSASSSRAIEFASEVPKLVSVQDILNLCHLYGNQTSTSITKYVHLRLGEMPSYLRLQVVKQLCVRQYVRLALLGSLLTRHPIPDVDSLQPRPGSHMIKKADADLIDCVLDLCAEQDFDATLSVCQKQSYWAGCLQLWKKKTMLSWQQMLQLIVKLGDITLLDDSHSYGYLPKTAEEWEYFLHLYTDSLSSRPASDWTNSLTWEGISELMVKTIGPSVAIMVLQECHLPERALSPQFYQMCILESLVHRQQRLVVHNMLEKVDTYLWAKKQPHLAPQLLYAVRAEKQSRLGAEEDRQEYQQLFSRLSVKQHSEGRSMEDAEAHWGIAANITGGCRNCAISLTETVSHIVPGVIIFTCGHSFHKFCVPLKVCPLCHDDLELDEHLHRPNDTTID